MSPDFRDRTFDGNVRYFWLDDMLVCDCGFEVLSVPGYVIMSVLHPFGISANECVLKVLADIQTRDDAFQVKIQRVSLVDSEVCSEADVVIVCVSRCLHLLQCPSAAMVQSTVKSLSLIHI